MAADPTRRIRGRLHQRIRSLHLSESPLCVACAARGRTRLAVEVDHIEPLAKGGDESRDPFHNRQALCAECHQEKTARDFGHRPTIGVDGWPVTEGGEVKDFWANNWKPGALARIAKSAVPDRPTRK